MGRQPARLVDAVSARSLIDQDVESRLFTLDLGEDAADVKYLEVDLPRFSTWYFPGKRVAPELVMLHQALQATPMPSTRIHESISADDRAEIKKLIKVEVERAAKKEVGAAEKDRKSKDLTFAKNILTSFVKSLYAKRSSWASDLSGDKSS